MLLFHIESDGYEHRNLSMYEVEEELTAAASDDLQNNKLQVLESLSNEPVAVEVTVRLVLPDPRPAAVEVAP